MMFESPSNSELNANSSVHNLSHYVIDVLKSIREPLQIFYIRACLLSGRLKLAEQEINLMLSKHLNDSNIEKTQLEMDKCDFDADPVKTKTNTDERSSNGDNLDLLCSNHWSTGNSLLYLKAQLMYLKVSFIAINFFKIFLLLFIIKILKRCFSYEILGCVSIMFTEVLKLKKIFFEVIV